MRATPGKTARFGTTVGRGFQQNFVLRFKELRPSVGTLVLLVLIYSQIGIPGIPLFIYTYEGGVLYIYTNNTNSTNSVLNLSVICE